MSIRAKNKQNKALFALEQEINNARSRSNWSAFVQLAKKAESLSKQHQQQNVSSNRHLLVLEHLLLGEAAFETNNLNEASRHFLNALQVVPDSEEALSFLGRVEYQRNEYEKSLEYLNRMKRPNLDSSNESFTAEEIAYIRGLLIKGECYERLSRVPQAIATYRELSESFNKSNSELSPTEYQYAKNIVFETLLRIPLLYEKLRNMSQAVTAFRECLCTIAYLGTDNEIQDVIQRRAFKDFGRVLLHYFSKTDYTPAERTNKQNTTEDDTLYPRDLYEEAILVLLLYEQTRKAGEQEEEDSALENLFIALCRVRQYPSLAEVCELALSRRIAKTDATSDGCTRHHLWSHFALSLIQAHSYARAFIVLKQCIAFEPDNVLYQLQCAKICINNLGEAKKGLDYATAAVSHGGFLLPKSLYTLGVAHMKLAFEAKSKSERETHQMKALETFHKAHEIDPTDEKTCFCLALQYAEIREVPKAFEFARLALNLNKQFAEAWLLVALLFSAIKDHTKSMKTCKAALKEHPNHFGLLLLYGKLEEEANPKGAASIYKHILNEVKRMLAKKSRERELFEDTTADDDSEDDDEDQGEAAASSKKSKEVSSYEEKEARKVAFKVYTSVAYAYFRLSMFEEAQSCTKRASTLIDNSPETFFQMGYVYEKVDANINDAVREYEKALALDADHVGALVQLGIINYTKKLAIDEQKNKTATAPSLSSLSSSAETTLASSVESHLVVARNYLQNAIRVDPTYHHAWYHLGEVLKHMGQMEEASECFLMALKLERTAPIIPFSSLLEKQL